MDPGEYCREIEGYLCRKNDGHLIRVVGPSFELVCGWATRGVPLKIAFRGIDRYFERYYAKGQRRRPVRIDFCEADVLDVFDDWRRAVGVRVAAAGEDDVEFTAERRRSRTGLGAHLDRILERIAAIRSEARASGVLGEALGCAEREVGAFRQLKAPVRGDARARVCARLAELDREILDAARHECEPAVLESLRVDATAQIESFRERMPEDAYQRAVAAATDRLLREREHLPTLTFD